MARGNVKYFHCNLHLPHSTFGRIGHFTKKVIYCCPWCCWRPCCCRRLYCC
ncbi:MAG: hypothetical protein ACK55Z_03285 [bacterium]